MRSVAFVTRKGGSGKSTLSASLAVAAQAARERVFLIDMDPQRSLATWAAHRADENLGVEAINSPKLPAVMDALAESGVTLAIIDTPAGTSVISEAAMQAADLIVIPVRPTAFDVWTTEVTWRRARELEKECVFVLNQCPIVHGSRRLLENIAALEELGGILRPMITARVDYQEAIRHGKGPTEINPSGDAAEEMRQLWMSLRRRLNRISAKAQPKRRAA